MRKAVQNWGLEGAIVAPDVCTPLSLFDKINVVRKPLTGKYNVKQIAKDSLSAEEGHKIATEGRPSPHPSPLSPTPPRENEVMAKVK